MKKKLKDVNEYEQGKKGQNEKEDNKGHHKEEN